MSYIKEYTEAFKALEYEDLELHIFSHRKIHSYGNEGSPEEFYIRGRKLDKGLLVAAIESLVVYDYEGDGTGNYNEVTTTVFRITVIEEGEANKVLDKAFTDFNKALTELIAYIQQYK